MQTVDDYLTALEHPQKDAVEALRAVILASDPAIAEGIKWNSPSFRTGDWFATMNLRPKGPLRLVLHTGAKLRPGHPELAVDDPAGLLVWLGTDRAIVSFDGAADVEAKRAALTALLQQWVPQLPS